MMKIECGTDLANSVVVSPQGKIYKTPYTASSGPCEGLT